MKGIKMFVAVTLVAGVASLIGCRSGGNEEGSSANETSSVTEVADPKPLDGVAEALETEGYSISNRGPGQLNTDSIDIDGGGALGDAGFYVLQYDDKNKALTEGDSIAQVFTGKLADRGIIEVSSDKTVLYQVVREGSLSDAQIAEFRRLMSLAESSR